MFFIMGITDDRLGKIKIFPAIRNSHDKKHSDLLLSLSL